MAELKPRQDELITMLAADPAFARISTAEARMRFTVYWLLDRADGLRLEAWCAKELASSADKLLKKNRTKDTHSSGQLTL